jgi:hypothetical protein
MTWRVYAQAYETDASLTDFSIVQEVSFDYPQTMRAALLWLVFFNDPTFTSLSLKVYNSNLTQLIATSTARLKADLFTENYAVKQVYFEFGDLPLFKDTYNLVLSASGYSGASSSKHIGWKLASDSPNSALSFEAITSRFTNG